MSKNLLIGIAAGLVCVAIAVWGILYMHRGGHLEMPGSFLKVRTAPLDDNSSVVMIDFRITNSSDYPAIIRSVTLVAEEKNGNRLTGYTMADPDAVRVFEALPLLGQKFNPSLILRDEISARATWDRMIGARFDAPESRIQQARLIIIVVEESEGRVFEISGSSPTK